MIPISVCCLWPSRKTELGARPDTVVRCPAGHLTPSGEVVEWFMALVLKTDHECRFCKGFEGFREALGPLLDRFGELFGFPLQVALLGRKTRVI